MKTNNWPIVILILYFVINTILIIPVTLMCFYKEGIDVIEALPYGLIIASIMLLAQLFLFGMKVDITEKRPVAKRNINGSVIMVGLIMALLTFLALIVSLFAVFGEGNDNPIEGMTPELSMIFLFGLFFGSWTFWALQFYKQYTKNSAETALSAMTKSALVGSVLELLIAIPSHIIMRNRGDCCAPAFSFMGILLGVSVALFAFGPGLVFLYMNRMKGKVSKNQLLDD